MSQAVAACTTREAETGGSIQVQGQPGLQNEFQDSLQTPKCLEKVKYRTVAKYRNFIATFKCRIHLVSKEDAIHKKLFVVYDWYFRNWREMLLS